MAIPGDLIENGLERVDGHDTHARLDEPAGEQTALAEGSASAAHRRQVLAATAARVKQLGSILASVPARCLVKAKKAPTRPRARQTIAREGCRFLCFRLGPAKAPTPACRFSLDRQQITDDRAEMPAHLPPLGKVCRI